MIRLRENWRDTDLLRKVYVATECNVINIRLML